MERLKDFCSELGVTVSDVENRLSKMKPNAGDFIWYNRMAGSMTGELMPFYFCALSLVIKNATNVLELGTGYGLITKLLANLYPTATVYTIDLPVSDKDYKRVAWRRIEEHMERFKRNIISRDNIKFIEKNSFFLPSMGLPREFDFIYVDGGHMYPVVVWDVVFAYNSVRPDGFLFFHDYRSDGQTHVKAIIECIKDIIDEEIKYLPSATKADGRWAAWLKKLATEEK